ncbi:MAG TPA: hypothetical protein VGL62_14770 [Vicinamibacterales bacterium]|jgi:hypothetical protein
MQVPPPIKTNGSGIVHPPIDVFVVVDVVDVLATLFTDAVVDDPDAPVEAFVMPPGIQPPLTHLPPPIAANGSGVVQPALVVDVDDDVVADVPLVVELLDPPVVVAVDVVVIPPGIQPPLMQAPPPIAANGSGVAQPPAKVDVLAVVDVVAVDAVVVREVPGIHPPLTHVPPPIDTNGSGVVHVLVEEVDVDDVDDDDVDVDDPVSVNESNAELVPTPNRPVAIQVSYVSEEPTVRAQTSSK